MCIRDRLSTVLVIVLNIIILAAISANQTANGRPWTTAKETAEALQETETGYILSGDMTERLSGENAWAIYIDNDTLEVKWHTENLPDTVPLHYTISDIASLTREMCIRDSHCYAKKWGNKIDNAFMLNATIRNGK